MRFYQITLTSAYHATQLTFARIQADSASEAAMKAYAMVADPTVWLIYDAKII